MKKGLVALVVAIAFAGNEKTAIWIRPGFGFASVPDNPDDSTTTVSLSALLGVEHFFSDWFSLGAAHGFELSFTNPGNERYGSYATFGTRAIGVNSLGFHIYPFGN
jgi:hypothetical protein